MLGKIVSRSIKVNENLFLVNYSAKLEAPTTPKTTTNHIWIYDRSGSMYSLLDRLVEDLIVRARNIPLGDTLTLGWFSSEGQRNFILKGFKVTDTSDYSLLEQLLRQNKHTLGCTCFSEILADTDQVITDLSVFSAQFALCFFTDGYPVVSSYYKEIDNIHTAISKISSRLTSALFVGYGDYYNKQLMSEMAEKIGGSLTHADNLANFSVTLDAFVTNSESSKKVPIQIDDTLTSNTLVFNLTGSNVNLYTVAANNEVYVSVSDSDTVDLYVLTDSVPNAKEVVTPDDSLQKALYASAYLLTQRTKTDVAIDVLGFIGDKRLIDGVTNSYTNAEYGRVEKSIQDAIIDPDKRYLDGKVSNYVPPADAFCLLDLIDLLGEDDSAYFYPRHKDFIYKKIGRSSKPVGEYPDFVAEENTRSSFRDIVWNETKINLSLRAFMNGSIDLGKDAAKFGLMQHFPTFQHRNYTFVKDGILNVSRLPASFSEKVFATLIQNNVLVLDNPIERMLWEKDKVYTLNLDAIPVVNRKIAESNTSAIELCKRVIEETEYKAIIKTLKWSKVTHYPEREVTAENAKTFAERQQLFLESKGINVKTGAFEPKMETLEATDFYMAKEFDIKVKGLSSLPKVEAVYDKLKSGKKLTTSDKLITAGIHVINAKGTVFDDHMKDWLETTIADYQGKLKGVRRKIQETKFAILLGKKWFTEFTSREENKLTMGDYEFTISLAEKKVGY
jgi:hypothetical protein